MQGVSSILLSIPIGAGILFACGGDSDNALRDRERAVRTEWERQSPFVEREFKPFLEGRWIGNAVAYGCYRKGQAPGRNGPSEAEILDDLTIITRYWNLIRVYGADDDTRRILRVIRDNELPVRVMLGIWLEDEEGNVERREANERQMMTGIELANEHRSVIAAVSIGNETQVFWSGHKMSTDSLVRYIRQVRNSTSVPVATADDYNYWNKAESRRVAEEVDFIVTHIHPLWNGKVLEDAIGWTKKVYAEVQQVHPDKEIVVGEVGWATDYDPGKQGPGEQGTLIKGEVSMATQGMFLVELHQWVNDHRVTTFLFEAFDESWKGGGEGSPPQEVEKHWGVFHEDRTPKESVHQYLRLIERSRVVIDN